MLLLRKPSAASPADEPRLKKDRLRVGMISVNPLHQKGHAAFNHVAGVVVHTAKGRRQMPCALNVVKADKRKISGNLPAEVFHQQARVPGLHITENKQTVDALYFPFRQLPANGFVIRTNGDGTLLRRKTGFMAGPQKSGPALLTAENHVVAVEKGGMATGFQQMFRRQIGPLLFIADNAVILSLL